MSLFGSFSIIRRRYDLETTGSYYPLDEYLNLPKQKFSYALQSVIGQNSSETDFRESVRLLNGLLPLNIQGGQAKRMAKDLAPFVNDFYEQAEVLSEEATAKEGSILAFGNDGKGIPIIKTEREETFTGEEARLMKGQKRGNKKQATVSVSFSFNPRIRQSEDVLRGLFREYSSKKESEEEKKSADKKVKDRRFSLNVHKRAFLGNQKKGIDYAIENLTRRDAEKNKTVIALVDCGPGLEEGILQSIENHGLTDNLDAVIADIVHVSEYIWKAANAILGEKFKGRTIWVREMMEDLLESKTDKVIKDLKANVEKTSLAKNRKETVERTIKYLSNHKHKMDYKDYLSKGYPISTGLIEGCCGHLIKDRMEHSGMRWTIKGAQNIIDLRAVKKNGDWKPFMTFIKNQNNTKKLKIRA